MAIYTQKYEQKWLKINNRGAGIKMSWVEKNRKINNRGEEGGTIIRNLRVVALKEVVKKAWEPCAGRTITGQ